MQSGSVTSDLQATIEITVLGAERDQTVLKVVVDTGLTDYLMLPRETILSLGWPLTTYARVVLADGSTVFLDLYAGSVAWEGNAVEILVLASSRGAYVGMALLYGSRIIIDTVYGGEVSIQPLP